MSVFKDMEFIREYVRSLLIEGKKEELDALLKSIGTRDPDFVRAINEMSKVPPHIRLIYARWLLKNKGSEPAGDIVPDLIAYYKLFNSGKIKGVQADINNFKTDASGTAVNKLRGLVNSKEAPLDQREAEASSRDFDVVYDSPNWRVIMPRTRESSISLARTNIGLIGPSQKPVTDVDPEKMTWCTARTSGQNMFYAYTGKGTFLFYCLSKKKAQTDLAYKVSIGVENGEINLSGGFGGVTVDMSNNGIDEEAFDSIFGEESPKIRDAVLSFSGKTGEHPSKKKFEEASRKVGVLKTVLAGLMADSMKDTLTHMLRVYDFNKETLTYVVDLYNSGKLQVKDEDEFDAWLEDDQVLALVFNNPGMTQPLADELFEKLDEKSQDNMLSFSDESGGVKLTPRMIKTVLDRPGQNDWALANVLTSIDPKDKDNTLKVLNKIKDKEMIPEEAYERLIKGDSRDGDIQAYFATSRHPEFMVIMDLLQYGGDKIMDLLARNETIPSKSFSDVVKDGSYYKAEKGPALKVLKRRKDLGLLRTEEYVMRRLLQTSSL